MKAPRSRFVTPQSTHPSPRAQDASPGFLFLSKVGALPCRFQRILHRVENARGVFRNGAAASRSGHRLVLVLRQQRLEAGVVAEGLVDGIDAEQ